MNPDRLASLIYSAIENKYQAEDEDVIRRLVREAFPALDGLVKRQTRDASVPTHDLKSDVINQLRCYILIERVLRFEPPTIDLIWQIHGAVCGLALEEIEQRDTEYVEDYGGVVPIPADQIPRHLREFETLLGRVDDHEAASIIERATYLAVVFATLIRLHPFRDGNGRTARMLVQYCLRRWSYDFVVLPKVRNDFAWKAALQEAVNADYTRLAGILADKVALK